MDIYIPSKEEWQEMQNNISDILEKIEIISKNKSLISEDHFPEYMDIKTAAKYLKCPIGRIKSMVYKQKILNLHHIDLTTTVYVSKKEIDDLKFTVSVVQKTERKQNKK